MLRISDTLTIPKSFFWERQSHMNSYNISYEVASAFFISICISCLIWTHRRRTARFKQFLILMFAVLFGLIFDVLGAVSIDNAPNTGLALPLLFNTLYFFFAGYIGLAYVNYTLAFV